MFYSRALRPERILCDSGVLRLVQLRWFAGDELG